MGSFLTKHWSVPYCLFAIKRHRTICLNDKIRAQEFGIHISKEEIYFLKKYRIESVGWSTLCWRLRDFPAYLYRDKHNLILHTLMGQCHEIFDLQFFSSNSTPWAPESWAKAFLNLVLIFFCIALPFCYASHFLKLFENFIVHAVSSWCQWPRMHRACGVNDPACTVHSVSMTPTPMTRQW
jgi:hypothetical protein